MQSILLYLPTHFIIPVQTMDYSSSNDYYIFQLYINEQYTYWDAIQGHHIVTTAQLTTEQQQTTCSKQYIWLPHLPPQNINSTVSFNCSIYHKLFIPGQPTALLFKEVWMQKQPKEQTNFFVENINYS
jgi:hypothetical protein